MHESNSYGTDSGPACPHCGTTIYRYDVTPDPDLRFPGRFLAMAVCQGCWDRFSFCVVPTHGILEARHVRRAHGVVRLDRDPSVSP